MAYVTIAAFGIIFSLSGILLPEGVASIFMKLDEPMAVIARKGIRIYFIAFLPMGINLLTSYYLQSVLSVKKSLCISLLRNIILSSIGILTFPLMFGADSLWGVMPVVEAIVFVVSMFFVLY